jgi:hypothetical protein
MIENKNNKDKNKKKAFSRSWFNCFWTYDFWLFNLSTGSKCDHVKSSPIWLSYAWLQRFVLFFEHGCNVFVRFTIFLKLIIVAGSQNIKFLFWNKKFVDKNNKNLNNSLLNATKQAFSRPSFDDYTLFREKKPGLILVLSFVQI